MSRPSAENNGSPLTVVISTSTLTLLSSPPSGCAVPKAAAEQCLAVLHRAIEADRSGSVNLDVAFFSASRDYLRKNAVVLPYLENTVAELELLSELPLNESLKAVFQATEQAGIESDDIDQIDFKQLRQFNRRGTQFVLLDAMPEVAQKRAAGICPSDWIISHQQLERLLAGDRRAIAALLQLDAKPHAREVSEGEGSVAKVSQQEASQQEDWKQVLDQLVLQRVMSSADLIQGWALAVAVIATILISLRVIQKDEQVLQLQVTVPDLPPSALLQGLQLASQRSAQHLEGLVEKAKVEFETLAESSRHPLQASESTSDVDGERTRLGEEDRHLLSTFSKLIPALARADVNQVMATLRQVVEIPAGQATEAEATLSEVEAFLLSPLGGAIAALLPAGSNGSDSEAAANAETARRTARQPSASPTRSRQPLRPRREVSTVAGSNSPAVAAALLPALVEPWMPLVGAAFGGDLSLNIAIAPGLTLPPLGSQDPLKNTPAEIAIVVYPFSSSSVDLSTDGQGAIFDVPLIDISPADEVFEPVDFVPLESDSSGSSSESSSSSFDLPEDAVAIASTNVEPVTDEAAPETPEMPETPTIEEEPSTEESNAEGPITNAEETATEESITKEPDVADSTTEAPLIDEPVIDKPVSEGPGAEEPTVEDPVVEDSIVEEPIVEEPDTEEPETEDLTSEDPATEDPAPEEDPVSEGPTPEEPATEEPVSEEPAPEEPATEEPAPEEPTAEEPVTEDPIIDSPEPVTEPADPTILDLGEGNQVIEIPETSTHPWIIYNFGGIGTGTQPEAARVAEADTLKFVGPNLIAENLRLTQVGNDLKITFDQAPQFEVLLADFALENLDNLTQATTASVDFANLIFDGETGIFDSIDIFNADWHRQRVLNPNTVTFLNDLNNQTTGFEASDDIIHGQGGNDRLTGLSGDDRLLGGDGDDQLIGGRGYNHLEGGAGRDRFYLDTQGYALITDLNLEDDTVYLPTGVSRDDILIVTPTVGSTSQPLTEVLYQGQAIAGFEGSFTEQQIFDVLSAR